MKKTISIMLFGATIFALSGCGSSQSDAEKISNLIEEDITTSSIVTPTRPAEINGTISSVEGNKIIVKNEVGKEILSEEEQAKRKEERQNMTQEERQALRAEELVNVDTEDVALEIPVGTTVVKGAGDGSGNSVKASLEEIKKGVYISIWKSGDKIEFVKIKGI